MSSTAGRSEESLEQADASPDRNFDSAFGSAGGYRPQCGNTASVVTSMTLGGVEQPAAMTRDDSSRTDRFYVYPAQARHIERISGSVFV